MPSARGEGGGGGAGAPGRRASADPLPGNPSGSVSPSSQSAQLREHLSGRGPITLRSFGKEGRDPQDVCWGRDPTCWALSVIVAYLGSGMLGGR